MPRRLAQQRMTFSDLEWPFHSSRAISAVAELLVRLCCYDHVTEVITTLHWSRLPERVDYGRCHNVSCVAWSRTTIIIWISWFTLLICPVVVHFASHHHTCCMFHHSVCQSSVVLRFGLRRLKFSAIGCSVFFSARFRRRTDIFLFHKPFPYILLWQFCFSRCTIGFRGGLWNSITIVSHVKI